MHKVPLRPRFRRALIALALGCTGLAGLAHATPVFPEAGNLPHTAIPSHYAIAIDPDATALRFAGTETIDVTVPQAVSALVLNAAGMTVTSAALVDAGGHRTPLAISSDAAAETLTLAAPASIAAGDYQVALTWRSTIATQPNGLFALDYTGTDGKPTRALFTQFEPSDARRFAPMFDEPSYKARFDLSVIAPANRLAVSNMPVAHEDTLPDGRKRVTFATTPRMASYLLFLGVGDFERKAKMTSAGVEAGIVAPRGSGHQVDYALTELAGLIPFYNAYFGVDYPLPKIDNIAGPGQSAFFSAMENWGAVFTFQRDLLDDPVTTTPRAREFIESAQAHEVAHQWFGDLVTMGWWDDLWLNEGFASWMETKATDHFHPDWYALLGRVNGREAAMALDSVRTTHPIVQRVRTVDEANQAFDAITYQKGEAVLAMLEAFAGETTWRDGIRAYMAAHKFGNTRTIDLWNAVEAAGAKGLVSIATDYTTQPGVPLVRVGAVRCESGRTALDLVQDEFTRDRVGQPSTRSWHIPLIASVAGGTPVRTVLADRHTTIHLDGCGPVLLNAGQQGYFRVLTTPAQLAELTRALPGMAPIDQRGLVNDQLELAYAGYQPLGPALALLGAVPATANARVAQTAISRLADLHDRLKGDTAAQAALAKRAIALWKPRLDTLGFDPRADDTLPDADLRANLIAAFGAMGEPGVLSAARARFAALAADPHALDGPLKQTWLAIIAHNATPAEWDRLEALAEASTGTVDRANLFELLGRARDPALADRALRLALSDTPGATTGAAMITAVAGEHSERALDYFIAHRAQVLGRVDGAARTVFVERLASEGDSPAIITKLQTYAAGLTPDERKPVERALGRVQLRIANHDRVLREARGWLDGA